MKHRPFVWLSALATTLCIALSPGATAAAPAPPQPGDYIVHVENPDCAIGGPIVRVTPSGEATILAQGGLLRKPRGSAVQDDNTLIVADGQAGLLKLDFRTGSTSRIAFGPPWQPREVAIDSDGSYIVADWPDSSAATLQAANGLTSAASPSGRPPAQPSGPPSRASSPGGSQSSGPVAGPPAVYRITPAGKVTMIASGDPLITPHGMALDASGNIIVTEALPNSNGVIRVTPDGQMTVVRHFDRTFVNGAGVRVDAEGNYIVADNSGALWKVTADGGLAAIHRGSPFSSHPFQNNPNGLGGPRGVDLDSNGDAIVLDQTQGALYRVTPGGDVSLIYQGDVLCHPANVMIYKPLPAVRVPTPTVTEPSPTDEFPESSPGE